MRTVVAAAVAGLVAAGCVTPKGETTQDKIGYVRNMRHETLTRLYTEKPEARASVEKAEGYAVFSNVNVKIFALGSGQGYGVAVDNRTGDETFMRMAELGVGLGLGAKDIRTVFVFHNRSAFERFVKHGWSFGADAAASAKAGEQGAATEGEVALDEGVTVYQLTETGLMASAMLSGTKYWRDSELN
jgi:lipid-binding SYLF domain-containing protein